jgi:hypothetical protein
VFSFALDPRPTVKMTPANREERRRIVDIEICGAL